MNKKSNRPEPVEVKPVKEDPEAAAASALTDCWVGRLEETGTAITSVQAVLLQLTELAESLGQQHESVLIEAELLASLQIDVLRSRRGTSHNGSGPRKGKRGGGGGGTGASSRVGATARPGSAGPFSDSAPVMPTTLEEAAASVEDRRRGRVRTALMNVFNRRDGVSGVGVGAGAGAAATGGAASGSAGEATPPPAPECAAAAAEQLEKSSVKASNTSATGVPAAAAAAPHTATPPPAPVPPPLGPRRNSNSMADTAAAAEDQRRPRDVPALLWEEAIRLRTQRLRLEQQQAVVLQELATQLRRFDLLKQSEEAAVYALDAVQAEYQRRREARLAEEAANPPPPAPEVSTPPQSEAGGRHRKSTITKSRMSSK